LIFGVSSIKVILGEPDHTLLQSFWDIETKTYLHYGIILAIIAILLAVVMKLGGRYTEKVVSGFDSCVFVLLPLLYIFARSVSNIHFCLCIIVSLILSIIIAIFYEKEYCFISGKDFINNFLDLIVGVGSYIFMVGIYLPCELFISNIDEFSVPFFEFFMILSVGSIIIAVLISALAIWVLPQNVIKIYSYVSYGLTIIAYVQVMVLNGELNSLDGQEQVWNNSTLAINLFIWVAVLITMVLLAIKKKIFTKIYKVICAYVFLMQLAALLFLIFTNSVNVNSTKAMMTTNASLELSENDNILVFLLDAFDSSYFDDIIEENKEFVSEFSDFTYYENMSSEFAHTVPSVAYLLNTVAWNDEEKEISKTDKENVLELLNKNGYSLGIYTGEGYVSDSLKELSLNYSSDVRMHCNIKYTIQNMYKTSLYKTAPFILKTMFSYYSSDISGISEMDNVWSIDDDMPFYEDLTGTGLSINEKYGKSFRIYHMRGPHAPFYLSEDLKTDYTGRNVTLYEQARASLNIVYEYLNQMKKLGIYDSATIIITADHGQRAESDAETGKIIEMSSPIMLVKKPFDSNNELVINYNPVSQNELFPTLLEAAGLDYSEYGKTFDEVGEDDNKIREYVDIYMDSTVIYSIKGNVKNIDSWSIVE
jgi:hypothetical protein